VQNLAPVQKSGADKMDECVDSWGLEKLFKRRHVDSEIVVWCGAFVGI
jgi:hypothetical protein